MPEPRACSTQARTAGEAYTMCTRGYPHDKVIFLTRGGVEKLLFLVETDPRVVRDDVTVKWDAYLDMYVTPVFVGLDI